MREIFIVTHGQKLPGADPSMTEEGKTAIRILREYLPAAPTAVYCGEARRHFDVAEALGFHHITGISSVFGAAGSREMINGKPYIVLSSGMSIPFEICSSGPDAGPSLKAKLFTLPDGAVICAGRECLVALGVENAQSASVYAVSVGDMVGIKNIVRVATAA